MAATTDPFAAAAARPACCVVLMLALTVGCSRPEAPSARPTSNVQADFQPLVPLAEVTQKCPIESNFADLMRKDINGGITRVSFLLFHDQREKAERLASATEVAGTLMDCMKQIAALAPSTKIESKAFVAHLVSIQQNAMALHGAVLQQDEVGARHWFMHLKQDCMNCHQSCRMGLEQADPGAGAKTSAK